MPSINLSNDEAQVIAVYRAIQELDAPVLVSVEDVGDVLASLRQVVDLEKKEKDLDKDSLKALIFGFVAGMGATNIPAAIEAQERDEAYALYRAASEPDTEFSGGPTGGVAKGQGDDPRFVKQTGPQDSSD